MRSFRHLLASVLVPLCVHAADFPEAVFLVDGSSSMQAAAGSQSKMEATKMVLERVIQGLSPEVQIGLASYGHRRQRDCSDFEILIAPGSADRGALLGRIRAIQPTGMSPIAASITQVSGALKSRDAETTIILISGGKESCGGDPCAAVNALKNAGVRFVAHVVGFDVMAEDRAQLSCIAGAGGGQYFAAYDANALQAALETVRREMEQKVKKAKSATP